MYQEEKVICLIASLFLNLEIIYKINKYKLMKTNILAILFIFASVVNSYSTDITGPTGSFSVLNSAYVNGMNNVWNINTGVADKAVRITYTLNSESTCDFLLIYDIDENGDENLIINTSGLNKSGTIVTSSHTGRAKVVFTSNQTVNYTTNSLYTGLAVNYSAENSTDFDGAVAVNGSLEVGYEHKVKIVNFPGHTMWMDFPVVDGKATGIGTGGTGQNLWIGYAGNGTQWFSNSSTGDVCYRNLSGKLLFGNTTGNATMTIGNKQVAIGTSSSLAKLDVMGSLKITSNGSQGFINLSSTSGNPKISSSAGLLLTSSNSVNDFYGAGSRVAISQVNEATGIGVVNIVNGQVGIGLANPDKMLTVNGAIHAKEIIVDVNDPLADYVFHPDYELMPLHKVEAFVKTNHHLPEIPSAAEVKENGLNMGEMQNKLLQKIEELTLYMIEQQKQIEELKAELKKK